MNSSGVYITDNPSEKIYLIAIMSNFNGLLINNRCHRCAKYIKSAGIVFSLYLCNGVGVAPGAIYYTGTMKRTVDSYYYSTAWCGWRGINTRIFTADPPVKIPTAKFTILPIIQNPD